jgi:hypothetical protein
MLWFEHFTSAAHPEMAAFGSQSCASLSAHFALHSEAVPFEVSWTQQTVPVTQFAWPLHVREAVSPPPPPLQPCAFGRHFAVSAVTQQTLSAIAQATPPHVCVVVSPTAEPPSAPPSVVVLPEDDAPEEDAPEEDAPEDEAPEDEVPLPPLLAPLDDAPPASPTAPLMSVPEDPPHAATTTTTSPTKKDAVLCMIQPLLK